MTKNIKIFTDPYGKFQMLTPVGYQYKNPGFERAANEPHAFGGYENNMGAFQISCKPVNAQIADLIMKRGMLIQTAATKKLLYQKTTNDFGDMITHVWMAAIEDHFVLATYIYEKKFIKRAEKELENVQACLESFKFIKPEFREVVLAERRYTMFMASTAAAIELRNKALENGSFIEIVILTANRIDGLLRLAIMLNKQLENQNDEIDTALLFQDEQDKIVAERAIYKMGLEQGIITQDIYDRLELLYKERNKVVHRYIITDIRTEQVIKIVFEYYDVEELVDKVINDLEMKQFTMKIGINANTEPGKLGESGMERLMASVKDKHGNINWGPKEEKIRKIPIKKS